MTTFNTVTLYPSSQLEGKDYQRLNLGSRQLNKLIRALETAPDGTIFSGTVAGLFVTIEKKAPAPARVAANTTPAYRRAIPAALPHKDKH